MSNIIMELRKCCNHPYLFPGAEAAFVAPGGAGAKRPLLEAMIEASGKLALVDQMIRRLRQRGHRILIYTQFITVSHHISAIAAELRAFARNVTIAECSLLHGVLGATASKYAKSCRDWQWLPVAPVMHCVSGCPITVQSAGRCWTYWRTGLLVAAGVTSE